MYLDPFEVANLDTPEVVLFETPKAPLVAGPGEVLVALSRDYHVLLNEADLGVMQGRKFYAHQSRSNVYARNREIGFLHQLICQAKPGWVVDHLNRNSLDCRRNNLRVAGYDANAQNASYLNARTGFRGVSPAHGRFRARIAVNGEQRHLGYFDTAEDAALAYDAAATTLYGAFAWTNFQRDLTPGALTSEIPF